MRWAGRYWAVEPGVELKPGSAVIRFSDSTEADVTLAPTAADGGRFQVVGVLNSLYPNG